jgi:1-acyl-sn-glycerol-3-phosphate acyltransferase
VKVSGTENIDKNKTYIFMGNHVSMLDMPLILGYIPVYFRAFEASSHFKTPFYGSILKAYGNLPMERSNPKSSMKSILKGVEILKEGTSMVILPEGARTVTGEMDEFKKFPFLLAKKSGANIIPFGMSGLWTVNNKTSWHVSPGRVDLKFGEEITAEEIAKLDIDDLKDLTKEKVKELVDRP